MIMSEVAEICVSQRAIGDGALNKDDLYLIPSFLAEHEEFPLPEDKKFIRLKGATFTFIKGLWERKDGDPCEEEPGMIYAMGHVARVLPVAP